MDEKFAVSLEWATNFQRCRTIDENGDRRENCMTETNWKVYFEMSSMKHVPKYDTSTAAASYRDVSGQRKTSEPKGSSE